MQQIAEALETESKRTTMSQETDLLDRIFDLDSVSASLDGNKCYPKGIEHVVLNGRVVVEGGSYDGAMAGRVLRRGEAAVGGGPSPA